MSATAFRGDESYTDAGADSAKPGGVGRKYLCRKLHEYHCIAVTTMQLPKGQRPRDSSCDSWFRTQLLPAAPRTPWLVLAALAPC